MHWPVSAVSALATRSATARPSCSRWPAPPPAEAGPASARGAAVPSLPLPAAAAARCEALRAWRSGGAREQNLPAYVIFHDRTLREIALEQPADLDALAGIGGVGAGKLERYGQALLQQLAGAAAG